MDAFLNGLVGEWTLSGKMGDVPLEQIVRAEWVLDKQYVEMRFLQTDHDPASEKPPYEAMYMIGFDKAAEKYVFHLFDTFGVSKDYHFGVGKKEGDRIPFVFDYASGPFHNTLEFNDDTWHWLLESEENGERKTFATKQMTRWSAG